MIDTSTYQNFYDYLRANRSGYQLFHFVKLTDNSDTNSLYYSDYHSTFDSYVPTKVEIAPVSYSASLYNGNFVIKEVKVKITNVDRGDGARFIDKFSSYDYESGECLIYLGYEDIASTSDLFPFYVGDMVGFKYGMLNCEFTVINRSVLELPKIPKNKFDRTSYPDISKELIDHPIPIVYGRWNYEPSGTTKYGQKSFVPAYVIENRVDETTPKIKLEIADHAIDVIDKVFLFDGHLQIVGEIQDTQAQTLSEAQVEITLNTSSTRDFLTSHIYLFADRYDSNATTPQNPANAVDFDFDTYAQFESSSNNAGIFNFPFVGALPQEELEPIYIDSTGETTIGIVSAQIQLSGYPSGSYSGGDTFDVDIKNSTYSEQLDSTDINALSDSDTFNVTSLANLQLCYAYKFNGSTNIFTIQEAEDASGTNATGPFNVQPSAGYYFTMTKMAAEIERKLKDLTDAGSLNMDYAVTYIKTRNRIKVSIVNSDATFDHFRINSSGQSSDIGYSSTTNWVDDEVVGNGSTVLDVPDGDFSNIRLNLTNRTFGGSGEDFRVKGIRIKIVRTYRDYNLMPNIGIRYVDFLSPRQYDYKWGRIGGFNIAFQWKAPIHESNLSRSKSIRDSVSGSNFFVAIDGRPDNGSYFKKSPEIIQSILEDYIGVATADIDTTGFTTANGNRSHEIAFYLDAESDPNEILSNLARYGFGFWFVGQENKYKMIVTKSSYSSGDVDTTIYLRDVKSPSNKYFMIGRNKIKEISSDLDFHYLFNWATDDYNERINRTTNSNLNIQANNLFCPYVTDDTHADTVAEYFSGDGVTYGQFGELKTMIEFTTLNLEYHFNELGDIMQFDTEFDSEVTAFGSTLSDIYFMVVGKQYSKNEIKITLLEVG